MRIAMWSGPRNISTAMMRSFDNRPDCFVTDEPLYAHYLEQTGLQHPGYAETLAGQERDWRKVVSWLTGPIPRTKSLWYQKHMAHHLLPSIDRAWIDQLANCFLIREPREMLTSLIEFIPEPRVEDTGLSQQVELFERLAHESGTVPPVIDGRDVLENPAGMLQALCARLGITWTTAMLEWPAGKRDTDGPWADYWYDKVYQTTAFGSYRAKPIDVPRALEPVLAECEALYHRLAPHRIRAAASPSNVQG